MYPQYQSKTQASCHRCIGWSTQYLNEPVLLSFCLDHDSNLNWSTCKRGKFHKRFPLPTLKWKNFLLRIKFFLFRVNTFNKGGWFIGKQTEVTTDAFFWKLDDNELRASIPLNPPVCGTVWLKQITDSRLFKW